MELVIHEKKSNNFLISNQGRDGEEPIETEEDPDILKFMGRGYTREQAYRIAQAPAVPPVPPYSSSGGRNRERRPSFDDGRRNDLERSVSAGLYGDKESFDDGEVIDALMSRGYTLEQARAEAVGRHSPPPKNEQSHQRSHPSREGYDREGFDNHNRNQGMHDRSFHTAASQESNRMEPNLNISDYSDPHHLRTVSVESNLTDESNDRLHGIPRVPFNTAAKPNHSHPPFDTPLDEPGMQMPYSEFTAGVAMDDGYQWGQEGGGYYGSGSQDVSSIDDEGEVLDESQIVQFNKMDRPDLYGMHSRRGYTGNNMQPARSSNSDSFTSIQMRGKTHRRNEGVNTGYSHSMDALDPDVYFQSYDEDIGNSQGTEQMMSESQEDEIDNLMRNGYTLPQARQLVEETNVVDEGPIRSHDSDDEIERLVKNGYTRQQATAINAILKEDATTPQSVETIIEGFPYDDAHADQEDEYRGDGYHEHRSEYNNGIRLEGDYEDDRKDCGNWCADWDFCGLGELSWFFWRICCCMLIIILIIVLLVVFFYPRQLYISPAGLSVDGEIGITQTFRIENKNFFEVDVSDVEMFISAFVDSGSSGAQVPESTQGERIGSQTNVIRLASRSSTLTTFIFQYSQVTEQTRQQIYACDQAYSTEGSAYYATWQNTALTSFGPYYTQNNCVPTVTPTLAPTTLPTTPVLNLRRVDNRDGIMSTR